MVNDGLHCLAGGELLLFHFLLDLVFSLVGQGSPSLFVLADCRGGGFSGLISSVVLE